MELVWTLVAFFLTLMVFSAIFGDNPLFRLAAYLFVGVSSGIVFVMVIYQVLIPKLLWPLIQGALMEQILTLVLIVFSLMLLARFFPAMRSISAIPMGYLVGVGAAVVVAGAVLGTLFPQSIATVQAFTPGSAETQAVTPAWQLANGVWVLVGTVSTLAYFHFGGRRNKAGEIVQPLAPRLMGLVGQVFIGITFGSLFAGLLATTYTLLIERLSFLWNTLFITLL